MSSPSSMYSQSPEAYLYGGPSVPAGYQSISSTFSGASPRPIEQNFLNGSNGTKPLSAEEIMMMLGQPQGGQLPHGGKPQGTQYVPGGQPQGTQYMPGGQPQGTQFAPGGQPQGQYIPTGQYVPQGQPQTQYVPQGQPQYQYVAQGQPQYQLCTPKSTSILVCTSRSTPVSVRASRLSTPRSVPISRLPTAFWSTVLSTLPSTQLWSSVSSRSIPRNEFGVGSISKSAGLATEFAVVISTWTTYGRWSISATRPVC